LGLTPSDRDALGAWTERLDVGNSSSSSSHAVLPMSVHYSADKITAQGEMKLKVFAG